MTPAFFSENVTTVLTQSRQASQAATSSAIVNRRYTKVLFKWSPPVITHIQERLTGRSRLTCQTWSCFAVLELSGQCDMVPHIRCPMVSTNFLSLCLGKSRVLLTLEVDKTGKSQAKMRMKSKVIGRRTP